MSGSSSRSVGILGIAPLTPEYIHSEHAVYVGLLEGCLENSQIRNIALSGNYGTGKSSILSEFSRLHSSRVTYVSMSTLSADESAERVDKNHESRGKDDGDGHVSHPIRPSTNRIQQEIVKQLLYRENVRKTPHSRFRRIEGFRPLRSSISAAIIAFIITVLFLVSGLYEPIIDVLPSQVQTTNWSLGLVFLASLAVVWTAIYLNQGRIHVKSLSTGPASISLDERSVSYFDQYLDEIFYSFEVTKRDTIVFEDIDRFENSEVFETLRSLNTLLNSPERRRQYPIRFIYAIRDSVFDQLGTDENDVGPVRTAAPKSDPAKQEVARANRTKFFDIVIPVVPFVAHHNARDVLKRLLNEFENEISDDLVYVIAKHVPEMRLIKNAINEFKVFRSRVLTPAGKSIGLTETSLFAMMIYKGVYLSDFEKIAKGDSNLDKLYVDYRAIVAASISKARKFILERSNERADLDSLETRAHALGNQISDYIQRRINQIDGVTGDSSITAQGRSVNDELLRTVAFWKDFASSVDASLKINVQIPYKHRGYGTESVTLTISKSDIESELFTQLDPKQWEDEIVSEIDCEIAKATSHADFLLGAEIAELMTFKQELQTTDGKQVSMEERAMQILGPGLAVDLVKHGFLDRNFSLYASRFSGEMVSTDAIRYVIHHVDTNNPDPEFLLSAQDVRAVIHDRGDIVLEEVHRLNYSFVYHLLEEGDSPEAERVLDLLKADDQKVSSFIQGYLASPNAHSKLIAGLTSRRGDILDLLIDTLELTPEGRSQCLDSALRAIDKAIDLDINDASAAFLESNAEGVPFFTDEDLTPDQQEGLSSLLTRSNIRFSNISKFAPQVKNIVEKAGAFVVSWQNLNSIVGESVEIGLDQLQSAHPEVFKTSIEHLDEYAATISERGARSISDPTKFESILKSLSSWDEDVLHIIVSESHPEAVIEDLQSVEEYLWRALVVGLRAPATFINVHKYVQNADVLNGDIVDLIDHRGGITKLEGADKDDIKTLALKILHSEESIPIEEKRVEWVKGLGTVLEPEDEIPTGGNVIGLLLKHEIIADNEEWFALLDGEDWKTREFYLSQSTQFSNYVTPEVLREDELGLILDSQIVSKTIKDSLVSDLSSYLVDADRTSHVKAASYAASNEEILEPNELLTLAQNGAKPNDIVWLLGHLEDGIAKADVVSILQSLHGPYAEIAERGHSRPTIDNDVAHRALLDRLIAFEIVSSYTEEDNRLRVHLKKP